MLNRFVPWTLAVGVLILAGQSLAEATWQPSVPTGAGATFGNEAGGWALNDNVTWDGTTATTNIRSRCEPCPTCEYTPYVATWWFMELQKADGTVVGSNLGLNVICQCPSGTIPISASKTATGATKAVINAYVKCGCCPQGGAAMIPADDLKMSNGLWRAVEMTDPAL